MFRPSDTWNDYGSWEGFCNQNPQFAAIQFHNISTVASKHYDMPCAVTPGKFEFGGLNVLFEVVFNDGVVWLCRAGWVSKEYSNKYVKRMIESTVTTMRYLKTNSTIPIPEVFAFEGDSEQSDINAAYIFLEPLPGKADDPPLQLENTIQSHVAAVTAELGRHTFPRIGWLQDSEDGIIPGPMMDYSGQEYGPFDTSVEYFKDTAQRIRLAHKSSQWASDEPVKSQFTCWLYDQLAPHLDPY